MEITGLLQRIQSGDRASLDAVIPLVYDELKKLASAHLKRSGKVGPMQTTVLVHEAFLKLAGSRQPSYEDRVHFYGIASRIMRQILVDHARARFAEKRSAAAEVPLAEVPVAEILNAESVLTMDAALQRLANADAVKAQLVEMRYFGGMTAEETAGALAMSVHVVRRELRLAQAWLRREIAGAE